MVKQNFNKDYKEGFKSGVGISFVILLLIGIVGTAVSDINKSIEKDQKHMDSYCESGFAESWSCESIDISNGSMQLKYKKICKINCYDKIREI